MEKKNEIAFGIDFGYENTRAAVWWNNKAEVVPNELSCRSTPSYYYFDGVESFVGKNAKDKTGTNPKNIYYDSKRLLARKIDDPLIERLKNKWTFGIKGNRAKRNLCEYIVNENAETISPIIVTGEILKDIKKSAEKRFDQNIGQTVITVPIYFTGEQIKAIHEAAKYANLDAVHIIEEPVAASIAYAYVLKNKYKDNQNLFVFDLGDEAFDVTIIKFSNYSHKILAARGDNFLGIRNFDQLIFEWMKQKLREQGINVEELKEKKKFKMKIDAKAVKEALSISQETPVILSDIFESAKSQNLTRNEFEAMSKELLQKLQSNCQDILQSANMNPADIDHILFVGGSSRMPMIAKMLKNIFGDENKFSRVVNPDEVVAIGAAMYAAACMKASKKPEILNLILQEAIKIPNTNISMDNHYEIPLHTSNYNQELNAVGIDLGTTECCAAVIRRNVPDCAQLDLTTNSRTMPSYIAFDEQNPKCGQIVIDRIMKNKAAYSVYDLKRIIGMPYEEIVIDSIWPFKVIKEDITIKIELETFEGKKRQTLEELYAVLLKHIKTVVESFEGKILDEAVITIPSNFNKHQIQATREAAKIAGWTTIHFIPEPIAAALSYCTKTQIPNNSNILICDCGGGTLDICIAKIVDNHLEILGCDGDPYLGGRDFDKLLFNHFNAALRHTYDIDINKSNKKYLLKIQCQKIKHNLSACMEDWIDVDDYDLNIEKKITINRAEFEEMATDLLLRIRSSILRTVSKISLQPESLDHVFQVGGGCRMPMIKKLLADIFPNANHRAALDPDYIVAQGAALYSYFIKVNNN